jgi:hypothetical protein
MLALLGDGKHLFATKRTRLDLLRFDWDITLMLRRRGQGSGWRRLNYHNPRRWNDGRKLIDFLNRPRWRRKQWRLWDKIGGIGLVVWNA